MAAPAPSARAHTTPEQAAAYHEALRRIVATAQAALLQGASALDATVPRGRAARGLPAVQRRPRRGLHARRNPRARCRRDGRRHARRRRGRGRVPCAPPGARRARGARGRRPRAARRRRGRGLRASAGSRWSSPRTFSTEARRQRCTACATPAAWWSTTRRGHGFRSRMPRSTRTSKFGTVGAVALDMHGHLAAATSTGGMTNKRVGRVGDSPLIGAGTYADDATAAVSCTGSGEMFIRIAAAHDLCARMAYAGATLEARRLHGGDEVASGHRRHRRPDRRRPPRQPSRCPSTPRACTAPMRAAAKPRRRRSSP